jgi:DNA repair exonuclease SbcCD ATPase subunit
MGENVRPSNEDSDHDLRRRISRPDSNALIQGLERLRESIEQRLVRLEAMARERAALPAHEPSKLEKGLEQRIAEYEEAQLRLRSQADRREQEWRAALEQLEGDRKLLAEAWERLESERIEGIAAAQVEVPGRSRTAERAPAPQPRPCPEMADPANDQVAHAILREFHALRNDVRRNARRRGPI